MVLQAFDMTLMVLGSILACGAISFCFIGENRFFDLTECLFIGGAAAITLFSIGQMLKSSVFDFILAGRVSLIIPVILGLLVFLRWTRWRWVTRYMVSVLTGVGLAITVGPTIRANILGTVIWAVDNLARQKPDLSSSVLAFVSVFTVFIYFTYSKKYSNTFHEGRLRYLGDIGKYVLYAAFGYNFAMSVVGNFDFLSQFITTYIYRTILELRLFFA